MAKEKSKYHHGNLKSALIQAAYEIILEEGYQAITLRAVAREANVSQAAPYHHFNSKYDLLCEVAAIGFIEMTKMLKDSFEKFKDSDEYLTKMSLAYVDFAYTNKNIYQLMGGKDIPFGNWPKSIETAYAKSLVVLNKIGNHYIEISKSTHNQADFTLAWGLMLQGLATTTINKRLKMARETLESPEQLRKNDEDLTKRVLSVLKATS